MLFNNRSKNLIVKLNSKITKLKEIGKSKDRIIDLSNNEINRLSDCLKDEVDSGIDKTEKIEELMGKIADLRDEVKLIKRTLTNYVSDEDLKILQDYHKANVFNRRN